MSDTSGSKQRAPRTTPQPGVEVEGPPTTQRTGFWSNEYEELKAKPGTWRKYEGVNTSIVSYLKGVNQSGKRRYPGLNAVSRNSDSKTSKGDIYVTFEAPSENGAEAAKPAAPVAKSAAKR